MITRRDAVKMAAAIAVAPVVPVAPASAAGIASDPLTFADFLVRDNSALGELFIPNAAAEYFEYDRLWNELAARIGKPAMLPLSYAADTLWSSAWVGGVRLGTAIEALRQQLSPEPAILIIRREVYQ